MHLTGLVTTTPAPVQPWPCEAPPSPPSAFLSGEARGAWIDAHLAVLARLAGDAGLDMPTIRSDALVVAAGRLPVAGLEVDATLEAASRAGRHVWVAAPALGLDAHGQAALRAAVLAFLGDMAVSASPIVVDCEVELPALLRAADLAEVDPRPLPMKTLALATPERATGCDAVMVSGSILYEDRDGVFWDLQPYVSNDDSRLQQLAAALYLVAGIPVAPTRVFEDDKGRLHAAVRTPPGPLHGMERASLQAWRTFYQGLGVDVLVSNWASRGGPPMAMSMVEGRLLRLSMASTLPRFTLAPHCGPRSSNAAWHWDATRELEHLLHTSPQSRAAAHAYLASEISLQEVADSMGRVLHLDDQRIDGLAERYALDDSERQRYVVSVLKARRNFMGSLSFLERVGQPFHERGTAPSEIRGQVVHRMVRDAARERRQGPARVAVKPAPEPRTDVPVSPYQPNAAVVQRVLELLRDPSYLLHPIDQGGVRLVYPIPGEPFLFKLHRRAAEALILWSERFGGDRFGAPVLETGTAYVDRLNTRTQLLVQHLGGENVYPEHHFLIPEAPMPGSRLPALGAEAAGRRYTLPLLASIQHIFPHIDAPDTLELRAPYAERGSGRPPLLEYWEMFNAWVLNRRVPGMSATSTQAFMRVHPRATVDRFIAQCMREEALREHARAFINALVRRYCPATGESVDLSGPRNGFWYLDEAGERKLAFLDLLYPEDNPILRRAQELMERFLRGEPLSVPQRCDLMNAVNFARVVNFMAGQLSIAERIDLFPDEVMKAKVAQQFTALIELFYGIPPPRKGALEPHPDKPWGVI